MSRYDPESLQQMARITLAARDDGDPRFTELVFTLSVITGLDPRQVVQSIEDLAGGAVE